MIEFGCAKSIPKRSPGGKQEIREDDNFGDDSTYDQDEEGNLEHLAEFCATWQVLGRSEKLRELEVRTLVEDSSVELRTLLEDSLHQSGEEQSQTEDLLLLNYPNLEKNTLWLQALAVPSKHVRVFDVPLVSSTSDSVVIDDDESSEMISEARNSKNESKGFGIVPDDDFEQRIGAKWQRSRVWKEYFAHFKYRIRLPGPSPGSLLARRLPQEWEPMQMVAKETLDVSIPIPF